MDLWSVSIIGKINIFGRPTDTIRRYDTTRPRVTRLQLDEDRGEIVVEVEDSPDRQIPCVALIPRAMCVVIPDVKPRSEPKPEPAPPAPEPEILPTPSPETEKSFDEVRQVRLDKPPKKPAKKRGRPRKKS